MKTNVEALKDLYVKMGGNAADVADKTQIAEMIDACSSIYEKPEAELPSVKATDNGKVLTVVDGKWAAAALPD